MPRSEKRRDPPMPARLAEFVASSVGKASRADEVYGEFKRQWRAAAAREMAHRPSVVSVSDALGIPYGSMHEYLRALIRDERLRRYGHGACTLYVPNEPEFTKGLTE